MNTKQVTEQFKGNSFLSTLAATMAVVVPIAAIAYFVAESRFVDKDEYHESQIEQTQVNQDLKSMTRQLDKRLDETNSHLKNLNTVLQKINTEPPRRRRR